MSWMRGADGSDASPEEFLAERRQASSRDKCAMKQYGAQALEFVAEVAKTLDLLRVLDARRCGR